MDWAVQPGQLNKANLSLAQLLYNQLSALQARLTSLIQELNNGLPLDKEGDPILLVNGKPGCWRREEEKNAVLDVIQMSLNKASLAMVWYKHSCTTVMASRIQHRATSGFFQ